MTVEELLQELVKLCQEGKKDWDVTLRVAPGIALPLAVLHQEDYIGTPELVLVPEEN